jgi:hypothetical protein
MTAGVNLKTLLSVALCLLFLFVVQPAHAARNIPVPARCTPAVNQGLADLIASGARRGVDNIMACGVAIERTRIHRGGPHGDHHITTISAALPSGRSVNVQIVTNDDLDGPVAAQPNDPVFAYGQGFIDHGYWSAGIHDVHCSTHAGADNGWVVIAGVKTPSSCSR